MDDSQVDGFGMPGIEVMPDRLLERGFPGRGPHPLRELSGRLDDGQAVRIFKQDIQGCDHGESPSRGPGPPIPRRTDQLRPGRHEAPDTIGTHRLTGA